MNGTTLDLREQYLERTNGRVLDAAVALAFDLTVDDEHKVGYSIGNAAIAAAEYVGHTTDRVYRAVVEHELRRKLGDAGDAFANMDSDRIRRRIENLAVAPDDGRGSLIRELSILRAELRRRDVDERPCRDCGAPAGRECKPEYGCAPSSRELVDRSHAAAVDVLVRRDDPTQEAPSPSSTFECAKCGETTQDGIDAGQHEIDCDAGERWTVVTDEGLAMFREDLFTMHEALSFVEENPTTASGAAQLAVPERVALELGTQWRRMHDEFEEAKREARRRATKELVAARLLPDFGEPVSTWPSREEVRAEGRDPDTGRLLDSEPAAAAGDRRLLDRLERTEDDERCECGGEYVFDRDTCDTKCDRCGREV